MQDYVKYTLIAATGIGIISLLVYSQSEGGQPPPPPPPPPTKECPRGGWYVREEGKACDPNYVPSGNECVCLFQ